MQDIPCQNNQILFVLQTCVFVRMCCYIYGWGQSPRRDVRVDVLVVLKRAYLQDMSLESLVNRLCAIHMCEGENVTLDSVVFEFMLWDRTASSVRMGCVGVDELVFVVSYESKRLFMGTPFVADCLDHKKDRALASPSVVDQFLREIGTRGSLHANVVFDGNLATDKTISFHIQFQHHIHGKSLLVKDVMECDNVLLVIDAF